MQPLSPVGAHDVGWLLARQARVRPRHPALRWVPFDGPELTWTYAELDRDARRLATGLQRRGVRPGDRVVLLMDNCPDFVLAWAGVALAGAVAVCLNTRSTTDELAFYARHCAPVGAIVGSGRAEDVSSAMPDLRWLATSGGVATVGRGGDSLSALLQDESVLLLPGTQPLDAACIQYTSGTTARPKAVVWSHANCVWGAMVGAAHQGLRHDDVNLVHLPLFHTNGLSYSLFSSIWAGSTVVLQPRFSASRFWEAAVRHGCTWSSVVSFCLRALADREVPSEHAFRGWGNSFCVPPDQGLGGVGAVGWFGMTETVSHPVCGDLTFSAAAGSMGRPAPEYAVAVVDESDAPVAPGEAGMLLVRGTRGVSLFSGYLGDDAATDAAFTEDGWFRTGDRVRADPDGTLWFVERDKDVLKVGGENVGAPEIERVLLGVPGVREAAVVGRPDHMLGEVPVAFVLSDDDEETVRQAAGARCAVLLPVFKQPREIHVVRALPRSTLDKVAKAQLRRLVLPREPADG